MATKKPRHMISVDDAMFNEMEDFRYEKRVPARSEATAERIRRACFRRGAKLRRRGAAAGTQREN